MSGQEGWLRTLTSLGQPQFIPTETKPSMGQWSLYSQLCLASLRPQPAPQQEWSDAPGKMHNKRATLSCQLAILFS